MPIQASNVRYTEGTWLILNSGNYSLKVFEWNFFGGTGYRGFDE